MIGLKQTLAPQLKPNVPKDIDAHGRIESAEVQTFCSFLPALVGAIGITDDDAMNWCVRDDARRDQFACRLDHAANGACGANAAPLAPTGIDRLQATCPSNRPAAFVEVPPRNASSSRSTRGVRLKSGAKDPALSRLGCGGFPRADHNVLAPKRGVRNQRAPGHFLGALAVSVNPRSESP